MRALSPGPLVGSSGRVKSALRPLTPVQGRAAVGPVNQRKTRGPCTRRAHVPSADASFSFPDLGGCGLIFPFDVELFHLLCNNYRVRVTGEVFSFLSFPSPLVHRVSRLRELFGFPSTESRASRSRYASPLSGKDVGRYCWHLRHRRAGSHSCNYLCDGCFLFYSHR